MKIYKGYNERTEEGGFKVVVEEDGESRPLDPARDVKDHSPDGFAWGYSGSGPAQLALALAVDLFGAPRAVVIYQELKRAIVAGLRGNWMLTEDEIRAWEKTYHETVERVAE